MSTDDVIVPLNLTQELLDTGQPGNCGACPFALAAQAAMPGATNLGVGSMTAWFDAGGVHHRISLPWDIRNAIHAIDDECSVRPRIFALPIPRSIASLPGFLADETLLSPRAMEPMPL